MDSFMTLNRQATSQAESDVYARVPLRVQDGIPVFSQQDDYTDNYEQIAGDHLASLRQSGANPFIPEDLWIQTEDSTELLIAKYARTDTVILDVGVGTGRLLSRFPQLRRFGLDISFGYLEQAKSEGIEVCYARVEDMPYREELFDVVVCTDVLEHVLDLNLCCRKMLSVLKPNGVLVARTPFREDLSWYASPACHYRYVHLRTFDEPSLKLLFEKVLNCKVIDTTLAGYTTHEPKLIPGASRAYRDFLVSRLADVSASERPHLSAALLKDTYDPIVINVAVVKSEDAADKAARLPVSRFWQAHHQTEALGDLLRREMRDSFAAQNEVTSLSQRLADAEARLNAVSEGPTAYRKGSDPGLEPAGE
jgi:2-polyprenyl-3-methyl-5-hydroxy-6-metoxy-1,4-benzoquinol methylase